jgi:hypothetical protein
MKIKTGLLFIMLIIAGCSDDDDRRLPLIEGLSIYWDHEIFAEPGRSYRFAFTTANLLTDNYELSFDYSILGKKILITLVDADLRGRCPYFPMPGPSSEDPPRCTSSGLVVIPESHLAPGEYAMEIVTPNFNAAGTLTIKVDEAVLQIHPGQRVTSTITSVYPVPADLIFGSIVYTGKDNEDDVEGFCKALGQLGLIPVAIPPRPYRHLTVSENGLPLNAHWQDVHYSAGLLYATEVPFRDIVPIVQQWYVNTSLNIYLYSSYGDQARFSQAEGVSIVYAR